MVAALVGSAEAAATSGLLLCLAEFDALCTPPPAAGTGKDTGGGGAALPSASKVKTMFEQTLALLAMLRDAMATAAQAGWRPLVPADQAAVAAVKEPPLSCVSTAIVAQTVPLPCGLQVAAAPARKSWREKAVRLPARLLCLSRSISVLLAS